VRHGHVHVRFQDYMITSYVSTRYDCYGHGISFEVIRFQPCSHEGLEKQAVLAVRYAHKPLLRPRSQHIRQESCGCRRPQAKSGYSAVSIDLA